MILNLFQIYNIYLMKNIYKTKLKSIKWLLSIIHVRIGSNRYIALISAKCDIDIVVKENLEIIDGENGTKNKIIYISLEFIYVPMNVLW